MHVEELAQDVYQARGSVDPVVNKTLYPT
jgi:hypothetical protein